MSQSEGSEEWSFNGRPVPGPSASKADLLVGVPGEQTAGCVFKSRAVNAASARAMGANHSDTLVNRIPAHS